MRRGEGFALDLGQRLAQRRAGGEKKPAVAMLERGLHARTAKQARAIGRIVFSFAWARR